MSKSGLIPYIDIVVPKRRVSKRGPSPTQSSSHSQISEPPSSSVSPRKRRKTGNESPRERFLSDSLKDIQINRELSPTASEFTFDDDLESKLEKIPSSFASTSKTSLRSDNGGDDNIGVFIYDTSDDDTVEDEDFVAAGETPRTDEDDEKEIPVRLLSDFAIYNTQTFEAVPLAELTGMHFLNKDLAYGASGLVKPWILPDDFESDGTANESDNEDSESSPPDQERVTLSRILEFSIHSPSDNHDEKPDSKMYIRTKFAWYILGTPSTPYNPFFRQFWIKHRLLHLLVVAALDDHKLSCEKFVQKLKVFDHSEESVVSAQDVLGRELCEADVNEESKAYIISCLPDLCEQNGIKISRVQAVRELTLRELKDDDSTDTSGGRAGKRKKGSRSVSPKRQQKKEKSANRTYLTPIVNDIAQEFFKGSLEVAESLLDHQDDDSDIQRWRDHKGHETNPTKIVWGEQLHGEEEEFYESVVVDGVRYQIGDIVMVEPDLNYESKSKQDSVASQTPNKYGNRWWFCQIQYFYEKEVPKKGSVKMFHGQWFAHGCKTLLQEASHSRALYFLGICDDNPITAIYKKSNVTFMQPGDGETPDNRSHDTNDFHCGLMYNEEYAEFVDIPSEALSHDAASGYKSCYSCDRNTHTKNLNEIRHPQSNTIIVHGLAYHIDEFVYIRPIGQSKVLDIGQIVAIDDLQIHVRPLGRFDDYVLHQRKKPSSTGAHWLSSLICEERHLFMTKEQVVVSAHRLDGKCHISFLKKDEDIQRWIKHDDHYYVNQEGGEKHLAPMKEEKVRHCKICRNEDRERRTTAKKFGQTTSKLVGMELFSGAGGLGIGMDLSGFVETKYAVELWPSAAKTYKANHPNTTVYCQDTSNLLKHAVDMRANKAPKPAPLKSFLDGKPLPPLPAPQEKIDFIFGGPPCQSFSRANHTKRRDDIRTTMPCNMLSYVEYYDPDYFLLENVAGFLDHRFYDMRETGSELVECEIKFGMVKLVVRTLITLGYQVRFRLLQAGQYGVPQSRQRVIFWGARRGLPVPEFPVPVYAFPKGNTRVTLPSGKKLNPATRSNDPEEFHCLAPLRSITVMNAIGDLPTFDWVNPHGIIPPKPSDRKEARDRELDGIAQFNAVSVRGDATLFDDLPGYPGGGAYATNAQNRYQMWLREEMDEGEEVTGHYTARYMRHLVEATTTVPLQPLADHRSLPLELIPNHAKPNARNNTNIFYGRMDGDGHFKCALTTISPVLKNQWPLHPTQKRMITVREAARAQGFPDRYIFESTGTSASQIVLDHYKMIGNAVAVPFALALGKELGKAMIKAWEKKMREGSPVL